MDISSQTLKEILESFKAQLFHTLDDRLDAFVAREVVGGAEGP
jgi:hypothetical protein